MKSIDLIGVGSPIVDLLAKVEDTFINSIPGDKGGMVLVSSEEMNEILQQLPEKDIMISPGGSAANTTFAASNLGLKTAFLGKLGQDKNASFYKEAFSNSGGDNTFFKYTSEKPTARCLSMITPDAERTMRTNLGAASLMSPEDISVSDFMNARHVHIEGYLLFNEDLILTALKKMKEAGCTVSLDLGSFEVVKASQNILKTILEKYVDIVFANEEEAETLTSKGSDEANLDALSLLCDIAVVKLGKKGALIKKDSAVYKIEPLLVDKPVDTTGAGDYWASGFLYGYLTDKDLNKCGELGSLMGAEVVKTVGTWFDTEKWNKIRIQL